MIPGNHDVKNEVEIMQIRWENWKPEEWKLIKDLDVIVTVFGADEQIDYKFLTDKEVDGILTNYPKRLFDYLKEKGMRENS